MSKIVVHQLSRAGYLEEDAFDASKFYIRLEGEWLIIMPHGSVDQAAIYPARNTLKVERIED